MKFVEANNIFLFALFLYLLSPYKSNSVKDISSGLKILESSLRSSLMGWMNGKKIGKSILALTARAQRINSILKTMSKFMFSKMTQAYT